LFFSMDFNLILLKSQFFYKNLQNIFYFMLNRLTIKTIRNNAAPV